MHGPRGMSIDIPWPYRLGNSDTIKQSSCVAEFRKWPGNMRIRQTIRPANNGMSTRHFEQAPRVDRPPLCLCSATSNSLPATQGQRWKDANSRRRDGYAERGVQEFTCHQPSSGKANFVSSSFHGRSFVLMSMSVILMVRRSSGSARPLDSLATSG